MMKDEKDLTPHSIAKMEGHYEILRWVHMFCTYRLGRKLASNLQFRNGLSL